MAKKLYPTDTLKQARSILAAWDLIDLRLTFGPVTAEDLAAEIASVQAPQEKIIQLKIELLSLRNERDAVCINLWSNVKRARAGIKATFGDDSPEYEMAGGTRSSDRKPYRRKRSSLLEEKTSSPLEEPVP